MAAMKLEFGVSAGVMNEVTPVELILGESLLTPGLQTSLKVHSALHSIPAKNLDEYRGTSMKVEIERPILQRWNIESIMNVDQIVYRLESRKLYNNNTEEFVLQACDQTLLDDAATLVSKYWKCTTPSAIVSEVLSSCAGAKSLDIESCGPSRDYAAENIHPFQVCAQQANAALANGSDPSFLHYMTYENLGTHHFRSLHSLTQANPVMIFNFDETGIAGGGYGNPFSIITHSFPCDFDLLSDILNGIDQNGKDINSFMSFNPQMRMANLFGSQTFGCGIGSGNPNIGMSNNGSEAQQNMCPDYASQYVLKRQARMGMLEQDKIALRVVVPWCPKLHAGKIITISIKNKKDPSYLVYGSGDYLIVSMTHNLKFGGYSTTTMDCVSKTVGQGIV